jgi:FMN-dependent oxidoreductase (nitrilotriacetate monooxygenase family)
MTAPTPLLYSAFVMNTTSHITQGTWTLPAARDHEFNTLDHWVALAQRLERGGFDFMFFADIVGLVGEHRGSYKKYVDIGLQFPANDPSTIASAIGYATERITIAFTSSILQEHPYNFARRIATLDHALNGRVAWNVVTNALESAARNFGQSLTPHDERYVWADEYMEVVYKLWEGSWEEGALVQDKASGIHADFDKIHKINHRGARYDVEGPFLVAPSPQRTPLLFQAGSSPAGRAFAARNAELQFLVTPSPADAQGLIADTNRLVEASGRRIGDLKFIQGLSFVIGSTHEEALRKEAELDETIDLDGMIAHFGGAIGVDLGLYDPGTPLADISESDGVRSLIQWAREASAREGREITIGDIGRQQAKTTRIVGTPDEIADSLERWQAAGIDGVNVVNQTRPGSYDDFIDQVMPVLVERGLARAPGERARQSARARVFGQDRLFDRHPGAHYRDAFVGGY